MCALKKPKYVREEMNNDILIQEVQFRPPLYNRSLSDYNDVQLKLRLWEEIAEKLFPHTWMKMNGDQRDKSVRDVQKRWKNLRACFTRELRHQKYDDGETKRRKYVYFDKLFFIYPFIEQNEMSSRTEENDVEDYKVEEEEYEIREDTINIPVDIPSNGSSSRKRTQDSSFFEFVHDRPDHLDSDTNFALSIVPMLKAIPFCDKIDAQIAVLKVLKKFIKCGESSTGNNSYFVAVKTEKLDDDDDE